MKKFINGRAMKVKKSTHIKNGRAMKVKNSTHIKISNSRDTFKLQTHETLFTKQVNKNPVCALFT